MFSVSGETPPNMRERYNMNTTTRPAMNWRDDRPKGSHSHETRPGYVTTSGTLVDANKYDALVRVLSSVSDVTTWHELTPAERRTLAKVHARVLALLPELVEESFGPY